MTSIRRSGFDDCLHVSQSLFEATATHLVHAHEESHRFHNEVKLTGHTPSVVSEAPEVRRTNVCRRSEKSTVAKSVLCDLHEFLEEWMPGSEKSPEGAYAAVRLGIFIHAEVTEFSFKFLDLNKKIAADLTSHPQDGCSARLILDSAVS